MERSIIKNLESSNELFAVALKSNVDNMTDSARILIARFMVYLLKVNI